MARSLLYGTPVAAGIAIGKAVRPQHTSAIEEYFISPEEIGIEVEKLHEAMKCVSADLQKAKENIAKNLAEHSALIQTHIMISRDPRLLGEATDCVRTQRLCAPWALQKTIDALCAAFLDIDDPYLRERALDLRAVGVRLQCHLAGKSYDPLEGSAQAPRIHMAEDLSPVDALHLPVDSMLALVMAEGGPTSHTAILARSLHIPAMVGVTGILEAVEENELIIVDALNGCVYIGPDEQELAHFSQKQVEYGQWEASVGKSAFLPAETLDSVPVEVYANVGNASELDGLGTFGAEGIGLYRTEYAYLRSRNLPTEDQLYTEYATVAKKVHPQRVVFRTLDVGADKMLHSQMALKEQNPALGLRAIRFCMRHKNLLRTQLRALLRAALHGNVSIILPMVTCFEELQSVKSLIGEVQQNLSAQGIEYASHVPVGIMIEVPAAVLIADTLAKHCDFLSIGTNDLVHYLLAIDRGNKHVAYLHQPLHPAVTRSIKRVIDCARREGIEVSVCGEMVADPHCLAMLLGMGVDVVSATPQAIPGIKHLIRHLKVDQCSSMAHSMLMSSDMAACRHIVTDTLAQSLRDDLEFYTTIIH